MRIRQSLLAFTLAAATLGPAMAAPTYVDVTPSSTTADDAGRKAARDILAAYPKAAMKAGTEGWVVLNCPADAHFAPHDCVVRTEQPAGAGFGAAALALAARTPPNPAITLPAGDTVQVIDVLFCQNPAAITPNLLLPLHTRDWPRVLSGPTAAQLDAAWPADAKAKGQGGLAIMNCQVALDGSLSGCKPVIEQPKDAGFAAAAASLAPDYQAAPGQYDGQVRAGDELQIHVQFGPSPTLLPPPVSEPVWMRCKYRG